MWQDYFTPLTTEECLQILKNFQGRARILAGGTDLIMQLKEGQKEASCLVDITNICDLTGVRVEKDSIYIGAATIHREIAENESIKKYVSALVEACSVIGSPQIRNRGTIAGNIISAAPAADAALVLFALGAELEVLTFNGLVVIPIKEVYEGLKKSKIDSTKEIVRGIRFPIPSKTAGTSFIRISQRKSLSLPVLNGAFFVQIDNGFFTKASIVLAPVAPVPINMKEAEKALVNSLVTYENIRKASILASEEANPRDSLIRGAGEIRKAMVKELVARGLEIAVSRAKQKSRG